MKNTCKNNRIRFWMGVLLGIVTMVSCTEWDDYKKYTKDGEIIYTGNFQGGLVRPGKERIRLTLLPTADPKVVKWKIFWNNNKDSAVFDFKTKKLSEFGDYNLVDTIFNVQEGMWSFKIFTYDDAGNSSVEINVLGTSYGAVYRRKIASQYRTIKSINYGTGSTTVNWNAIDNSIGAIQTEVRYTTVGGVDTVVVTPTTENSSLLKGFDPSTDFTYRTVFLPEATAIPTDTFKTIYRVPVFIEQELDRALFAQYPLPGDAGPNDNWDGVSVKKMWDGLPNSYDHSCFTTISGGQSSPQIITFDVGVLTNLTKVTIWPFKEWYNKSYTFSTLRRFEIWGSANPSASGDLDASWHLVASDTLQKPSGTGPDDVETTEDNNAALAGFNYSLDTNAPKIRYLRIRCLQNQEGYKLNDAKAFFSIGEIKVYGLLPKQ